MKNLAELIASLREPHQDPENAAAEQLTCLSCGAELQESEEYAEFRVCPSCRFHYNISARRRIGLLADPKTFRETNRSYIALDPISFSKDYRRRVLEEQKRTGLSDAIITGTVRIGGNRAVLAVIDFRFFGGTIGSVVGEKLALAFELAARRRRPMVVVVAGGVARLQEGPLALAQIAKIAAAQRRLTAARVPLICLLASPTTGAAYAGFASLADYIVAEPGALVGYASARAASRTASGRMSADAHTAEGQLRGGMIDAVVERNQQRELLSTVIALFANRRRVKPEKDDEKDGANEKVEAGAWHEVQMSRHAERPTARDYISHIAKRFVEFRGDRIAGDDPTVICGIGEMAGEAVVVVGQQASDGHGPWIGPAGFRKARRAMQFAARFEMPLVTMIDTPGAYAGLDAEASGLGHAIASCTATMTDLPTPTVAAIIGEGGGEAALAFGVADRALMLEHATFSVVTPERAAEMLYRDRDKAEEAAEALRMTARECRALKVVDVIVSEPPGGAHQEHELAARRLGGAIARALSDLQSVPTKRLLEQRYRKYRALGGQTGYITTAVAQELSELRDRIGRRAGSAVARIRRRPQDGQPEGEDAEAVLIP
jgi:acetyl-CoA carboxylase carboxyl transferase alpha subunit/acetyl-CoA carboxylase carboxyl transferase beta subunit